jgi:cytochrome c oxidase cbb3-type subunit 2
LHDWSGAVPKTIFPHLDKETADDIANHLSSGGCKVEVHIMTTGGDIPRWGMRRSVAEDFLWDFPVQLGDIRVGPDLADVGTRLGNANWQLQHLYAPQSYVTNSAMPPFRFLFETRKLNGPPSSEALVLPTGIVPGGFEVIPTTDAKNLVAYLLSLRADVPLHDAPFTAPAAKK